MREEMLARALRVRRILPADLTETSEGAAKVQKVESARSVVVREVARLRAVRADVHDREGLVGERVDLGSRPRLRQDASGQGQRSDDQESQAAPSIRCHRSTEARARSRPDGRGEEIAQIRPARRGCRAETTTAVSDGTRRLRGLGRCLREVK